MEIALTYAELCKQRCEWCAKGVSRERSMGGGYRHYPSSPEKGFPCAAPSPEAAYAELAKNYALLAALRAQLETLMASARSIQHWHEDHGGSVTVSAAAVRNLQETVEAIQEGR